MTELFVLASWEQHLAQHARVDRGAADIIRHARSFGRDGTPTVRHLAAVDVIHPDERPDWDDLVAVHAEAHVDDVPLEAVPTAEAPGTLGGTTAR